MRGEINHIHDIERESPLRQNNQKMKNSRINWSAIPSEARRNELKKLARKMKRNGFTKIQLNFHGAGKWSIDGFNSTGGVWIA